METNYWFGGWHAIGRIVVIATCGYTALLVLLRLGGWRRLNKMRLPDFLVTVTIGSAFGRMLTAREVGVVDAAVTFAMLILLQQITAWLQYRSPRFARMISPVPSLVYYRGAAIPERMHRERLREAELLQAARIEGFGSLAEVDAIVLEPDGTFSIIAADAMSDGSAVDTLADGREPDE